MEFDIQHPYRGSDSREYLVSLYAARPECACSVLPGDEDPSQGTRAAPLRDPQLVVE